MVQSRSLTAGRAETVTVSQQAHMIIISGNPDACLQWLLSNNIPREQITGFTAISTTSVAIFIHKNTGTRLP